MLTEGVHPLLGRERWEIINRVMSSLLAWLEWRENPAYRAGRDEAVGYKGGLKSVINVIQADSRGDWGPLPSSQEGRCYHSNYGNERWFLWLCIEAPRVGKACGEKRQVGPSATQYSEDCAMGRSYSACADFWRGNCPPSAHPLFLLCLTTCINHGAIRKCYNLREAFKMVIIDIITLAKHYGIGFIQWSLSYSSF